MRPGLELGNASDVGREREQNEDYFGYAEPAEGQAWSRRGRLLVVADGMGGAAGGAVASRLTVDGICAAYLASDAADPREALCEAVEAANERVHRRAQEDAELRGMGAAATAVAVVDGTAFVAQVGDTRAYLVRGGRVVQLTEDQSAVARMVREGLITADEAKDHPQANVIEQAVGQKPGIRVDTSVPPQRLEAGDTLVLCTDGLHGLVSPAEIARLVTAFPPEPAARLLVDLANGRGGPDNITVQVARFGPEAGNAGDPAADGRGGPAGAAGPTWRVMPAVAVASLVLAAVVGGFLTLLLVDRYPRPAVPTPPAAPDSGVPVPPEPGSDHGVAAEGPADGGETDGPSADGFVPDAPTAEPSCRPNSGDVGGAVEPPLDGPPAPAEPSPPPREPADSDVAPGNGPSEPPPTGPYDAGSGRSASEQAAAVVPPAEEVTPATEAAPAAADPPSREKSGGTGARRGGTR